MRDELGIGSIVELNADAMGVDGNPVDCSHPYFVCVSGILDRAGRGTYIVIENDVDGTRVVPLGEAQHVLPEDVPWAAIGVLRKTLRNVQGWVNATQAIHEAQMRIFHQFMPYSQNPTPFELQETGALFEAVQGRVKDAFTMRLRKEL